MKLTRLGMLKCGRSLAGGALLGILCGGMAEVASATPLSLISAYAGNHTAGYSGSGGAATSASINNSQGIAIDASDNLYISDAYNHVIRKVDHATHIITVVAGNHTAGYLGDNGFATSAELNFPEFIAFDSSGNLYIADAGNNVVRKVAAVGGTITDSACSSNCSTITTVAGNHTSGYSGDGGAAISAQLNDDEGIAVNSLDDIYIADSGNSVVRKVDHSTGIITTVAGTHVAGYDITQDGGLATAAKLNYPAGLAFDDSDNLYITDFWANVIRKVDRNGIITTIAGTGTSGYSGDGSAAASAMLMHPVSIIVDDANNIIFSDASNYVIRKIDGSGIITTIAGNHTWGFSGDNGSALSAKLEFPLQLAFDSTGNLYVADADNFEIRKISYETTFLSLSPHSTYSQNNWHGAPVTATLSFVDLSNGAGTAAIYAGLDGATPSALTGPPYAVSVSGAGTHELDYYSIDSASTEETHQSLPINIDTTAPSGTVGIDTTSGSGDVLHISFQDGLSGLDTFRISGISNAAVTASDTTSSSTINLTSLDSTNKLVPLTDGTTDNIQLVATRAAAGAASLTLNVHDQAGNNTSFDPVIHSFSFLQRGVQTQTIDGVKADQGHVTVLNGSKGIGALEVTYNGRSFSMTNLQPNENRRIDVSSARRSQGENSMILTARGDPGASATVALTDLNVVAMNATIDLNGDGSFDIRDVVRLLRSVVSLDSAVDASAGDANGDGAVNVKDVIALLRRLVQASSSGG